MKANNRKDNKGRNTALRLEYFSGFFALELHKKYLDMNIHERIIVRSSFCGNTFPSLCIKDLISFNNATA